MTLTACSPPFARLPQQAMACSFAPRFSKTISAACVRVPVVCRNSFIFHLGVTTDCRLSQ